VSVNAKRKMAESVCGEGGSFVLCRCRHRHRGRSRDAGMGPGPCLFEQSSNQCPARRSAGGRRKRPAGSLRLSPAHHAQRQL